MTDQKTWTIPVPITLTEQDVEGIIETAFYGAYPWWREANRQQWAEVRAMPGWDDTWHAVVEDDEEDEDGMLHIFTADTVVEKGIRRILTEPEFAGTLAFEQLTRTPYDFDVDLNGADTIMQVALLDEIRYG